MKHDNAWLDWNFPSNKKLDSNPRSFSLPAISSGQTILFTEDFENTNLAAKGGMTTRIRLFRQSNIFLAAVGHWNFAGYRVQRTPRAGVEPRVVQYGDYLPQLQRCMSVTG